MTVRDVTTLASKAIVIVNTDVAASQTVATRYCAMYGIPTANQFTYAMGTNVLWEYTADRYAGFWTDLYNKVQSVGAYAIFTTPGCPVGIELLTSDGLGGTSEDINGNGINFALLVGFVKRIRSYGVEPVIESSGGFYPKVNPPYWDTYLFDPTATNKGNPSRDSTAVTALVQAAADTDYAAAGGSQLFTTYRSTATNFSTVDNLLTGHIGYYTQKEATHPASLDTLSWPILGKAGNLQIPASLQSARVALVCPESLSGSAGSDAMQSLIGKKLKTLGLDVKHWYSGTPSAVAEALLPASGEYNWTTGQLDAATASPTCTYTLAVGAGFANNKEATWNTTMIPSTSGGVMCVGASYGDNWGKAGMVAGGHSYVQHMNTEEYGYHQTALQQNKMADIWLNLIAGRSLCEAAWCGLEYSFLACGDPLMKPFPT